ncbi:retrovirus-related Pol polyprotein from transposon TNT 1-94 [Trichonephila clavipes]|nr:retrovirus-related Pol polyprotein from transposon TNT 1-94 [Trichonephila clavipes]
MNSVASTLNRVTGMEFNNQISVLTPNNWNTWKHDMQVLLMHYGCWQFIVQTKPEQPDEEATYKEKLDLQLRKDRFYTLIYTNISSDLKNLITETTDGVAAWKILKDHFEPVTRARVIQLLDQFFGTKYQPGEDVGIFISRVKTAATRLQEAGHKLDDLYIGFQLIRWLPQEFQSTVQQIYRWKEEDFRVVKIEAELILEANRLQLMKQDLEKAENAYLSSFTSKKSKTLPSATAAAHGDPNGKNDYQKRSEFDKGVWVIDTAATSHFVMTRVYFDLKPITNMKMSLATEDKNCPVEGIGTLRFRSKDSLTSRLVSKTSTETPSTSEKPDVSSDNHSLIPCTEVKWIRNIGRKVTGSNVYYSIEGEATRLKSFNEIERYYTVIYMKQPTGYEIDNKVCKLRKAIYGLHQSGRQWFLELENKLIKLKFKNNERSDFYDGLLKANFETVFVFMPPRHINFTASFAKFKLVLPISVTVSFLYSLMT